MCFRSGAALLALCLGTACATAPEPTPDLPPATDADPLPHTPAPTTEAEAGGPVGIAISGGFNEARSLALRFLEAVVAAERSTLERLLNDRVALTQPRLTAATRDRNDVLVIALHPARRRVLGSGATVDDLVDTEGIQATTLGAIAGETGGRIPHGLESADVVLTIPLTTRGQRVMPMLLPGWRDEGKVVVRAGAQPRIVGI